MDRDRFRSRERELRAFSDRMVPLAKMPDRATGADLQLAVNLSTMAADTIDELIRGKPPGCICRTIEREDYGGYLDYAEACLHHGGLFIRERDLKEGYAKMEKALKNEVRMKLVAAALAGTASMAPQDLELFSRNALAIADEMIRRITGADPEAR